MGQNEFFSCGMISMGPVAATVGLFVIRGNHRHGVRIQNSGFLVKRFVTTQVDRL